MTQTVIVAYLCVRGGADACRFTDKPTRALALTVSLNCTLTDCEGRQRACRKCYCSPISPVLACLPACEWKESCG
jgi:hypothetical protein